MTADVRGSNAPQQEYRPAGEGEKASSEADYSRAEDPFSTSTSCPSVPTYEAGYLVGGNGGWRSERPVVTPGSLHGLPAVLPVLSRRRHLAA